MPPQKSENQFPTATDWIGWLGATVTACVILTAFMYQNFSTRVDVDSKITWVKTSSDKSTDDLAKRLERIEEKLDRITERMGRPVRER